jgi:Calcineurin-like phosphoesterase
MKNLILLLIIVSTIISCNRATDPNIEIFSFDVAADMRNYAEPEYRTSEYFQGACEALKKVGKGEFMISPGDIDPPYHVQKTIKEILGDNYFWYPVLGNHEVETEEDMEFLKTYLNSDIPNMVNEGPEKSDRTMYSFDFENSHFVVINQYFDGISTDALDGDISDAVYNWLSEDLAKNKKKYTFVFGHEPLVSMPDYDNGRIRHKGDNLDKYPENSFRFQKLLRKYKTAAYFCGHTHNFSYAKINGILQIDAGHARGKGDVGAQSTFLKVFVNDDDCRIDVYRSDTNFVDYRLAHQFKLD